MQKVVSAFALHVEVNQNDDRADMVSESDSNPQKYISEPNYLTLISHF